MNNSMDALKIIVETLGILVSASIAVAFASLFVLRQRIRHHRSERAQSMSHSVVR